MVKRFLIQIYVFGIVVFIHYELLKDWWVVDPNRGNFMKFFLIFVSVESSQITVKGKDLLFLGICLKFSTDDDEGDFGFNKKHKISDHFYKIFHFLLVD